MQPSAIRAVPGDGERRSQAFAALAEDPRRVRLVVPTQDYAFDCLDDFLRDHALSGVWGTPILSYAALVEEILRGEGEFAEPVGNIERRMVLRSAIEELEDSPAFAELGEAAKTEGFLTHLLSIIEALKQGAVEPEAFRDGIRRRSKPQPLDEVVAAAYARYQKVLRESGLYDRIGLFWSAAVVCVERRPAALSEVRALVFEGFDDFTPSELDLIKGLGRRVETVFLIDYDDTPARADLNNTARQTIERLREALAAETTGRPTPAPEKLTEYARRNLLWRGSEKPELESCRRNLEVQPCPNATAEHEYIARKLKVLIRDEGVSPDEIAVAFRDMSRTAPRLRSVLEEYGIPAHFDQRPSLSESAAACFLLALLDAVPEWPRDDVAALLASPWLDPLPGERDCLGGIHSLARLAGIIRGRRDWQRSLERLQTLLEREEERRSARELRRLPDVDRATAVMRARFERLCELIDGLPQQASLSVYAEKIDDIVSAAGMPRAAQRLDEQVRGREAQAVQALRNLLGRLHAWPGHEAASITLTEFKMLFRRAAESEKFSTQDSHGGVWVGQVERLKNRRFRQVIIGGLNEGVFPAGPRVSAIYQEADLREFRKLGMALEDRAVRSDQELALFRHALAAALDGLTITWCASNQAGRPMRQSPFLVDLRSLLGAEIERPLPRTDGFVPELDAVASPRELRNAVVHRFDELPPSVEEVLASAVPGIRAARIRNSFEPYNELDGVLADERVRERIAGRFGPDRCFSVNQIETWLACPFRFYAQRVLGVDEAEPPEEGYTPLDRGQHIHRILEVFHRRFRGKAVDEIENAEAEISAVADDIFARAAERAGAVRGGILKAERESVKRVLHLYLQYERENDTEWKPLYFETKFGPGARTDEDDLSREEPYALKLEGMSVLFSGVIDRIDSRASDCLRVIDYKTGMPPSQSDVKAGRSIQLPLYALAVQELANAGYCAEADYIQVGRKGRKKPIMERGKHWDAMLDTAKQAIESTVLSIREGQFPVAPSMDDTCSRCAYHRVCRYEKPRAERKRGDPS